MSIKTCSFGKYPDGSAAPLYILCNQNGMSVSVTPYGCRLVSVCVPDLNGNSQNVILRHETLEEYFGNDFQGAVVGRYANRIADASFSLKGHDYHLTANDGKNSLHGGPNGLWQKWWQLEKCEDSSSPSITFTVISKDGEEGYPGNLSVFVTYTLEKENALRISYKAISDAETPVNFTNHAFFNLSGNSKNDILSTKLTIHADNYTEIRSDLIPTGNLLPVKDTALDFTKPKNIGQDIKSSFAYISDFGGYDHNYVLNGCGMRTVAQAEDDLSKRVMQVETDLPGMQLYTANSFPCGELGENGVPMQPHHAFCLETQYFPDSVNHKEFPFKMLKPNVPWVSETVFHFSIKE